MSDQYVPIKREWLEGLVRRGDDIPSPNRVLMVSTKGVEPLHFDELNYKLAVTRLQGYISSAKSILEPEDYKDNLEEK